MELVPQIGVGYRGTEGHIGYLLRLAWHSVRTGMNDLLAPHGLSAAQYAALTVLDVQPSLSVAELARAIAATPQSTAGLVEGLEDAGLAVRQPHPGNRRAQQAFLTEEGQRVVDAARTSINAFEDQLEASLDDDARQAIRTWLVHTARASPGS